MQHRSSRQYLEQGGCSVTASWPFFKKSSLLLKCTQMPDYDVQHQFFASLQCTHIIQNMHSTYYMTIHVCAAPTWVLTQIEVGPAPSTIYCESPCASLRCRQKSALSNMAMPSFIVSLCRLAWNHSIEAHKTSYNALCTWFAMADPQMQIVTSNLDSGGLRGFCFHLVITNVSPQTGCTSWRFFKGRKIVFLCLVT